MHTASHDAVCITTGAVMRVLSLFSGIGGFDLGFERAGMQIVGMCEIDKHAQSVLTRHFPNATLHTDVREVSYAKGTVDLICGGFPCQDLSLAGKRRGLAGERSGLWFEFKRIINDAEPRWVVIENVPGLLSSNRGADLAVILHWLARRGYGVGWRVLDSQHFGLAQRRRRVFIVASLGTRCACTVLFEQESLFGHHSSRRKGGQSDTSGTESSTISNDRISGTVMATGGMSYGFGQMKQPYAFVTAHDNIHVTGDTASTLMTKGRIAHHTNFIVQNDLRVVGNIGGGGFGNTKDEDKSYTLTVADASNSIIAYQDISPTLCAHGSLASGDGQVKEPLAIHEQYGIRRLIPKECERLQGFPDDWTAGQSDTQRYKQLGNAVSVSVAEWIGNRIIMKESLLR